MKLERLTISNFLRIADLDIDLSAHPVHLFCGPNEAGKSTVAESIRFAILGDSPRVLFKKNYDRLLHAGAKKGSVSLMFGGAQVTRGVATGESKTAVPLDEAAETSARIAFGAQEFVDLKPDERRAFLFKLTEIKVTADDICERMKTKYEVEEAFVTRYRPLLKAGMDAALKAAKDDVSRLKGSWEQITGEKYGSDKATGWKPVVEPGGKRPIATSADALNTMRMKAAELQQRVDALTEEIGRQNASGTRQRELYQQLERARADLSGVGAMKIQLRELEETVMREESEAATQAELANNAAAASKLLSCPACDVVLKFSDTNELEYGDPNMHSFATDAQGLAAMRAQAQQATTRATDAKRKVGEVSERIGRAEAASTRIVEIEAQIKALETNDDVDSLTNARDSARAGLVQANQSISDAERQNAEITGLTDKAVNAAKIHTNIGYALDAVAALEVSGIRNDLLAEALEPINSRMTASARLAGWLAPSITPDMDVMREDGLAYELLSESAKWRLSAVVADAIASMSGLGVLILDRMDVLDLPSRAQALKWVATLGQDGFETVLVMATLKEPPKALPSVIEVHWMGSDAP